MKVFSEELPEDSELLRVGGDDWNDDGPYCLSVVAVPSGKKVMLKGLDKTLRPSHWRAIMDWARERGYEQITFRRKRGGRAFDKVLRVREKKHATR